MFTNTFKNNFAKYLIIVLILCSFINTQKAWSWKAKTCYGEIRRGLTGLKVYSLNRNSIHQGSMREADVIYSINQWNNIQGMSQRFDWKSGSDSTKVRKKRGEYHIYWVPKLDNGALGNHWYIFAPCTIPSLGGDGRITGSTITMSAKNPTLYGNPDENTCDTNYLLRNCDYPCSSIGGPGGLYSPCVDNPINPNDYNVPTVYYSYRQILLHELGHALGMRHHNSMNTMTLMVTTVGQIARYYNPYQAFAPFADEVNFALKYHKFPNFVELGGGSGWDFAALSWKIDEDHKEKGMHIATMDSKVIEVCPGDTVDFRWTLENKSILKNSEDQKLTIEYGLLNHVNNTDPFSNSYRFVKRITAWNNEPGYSYNMHSDLMIPTNMLPGDYRLAVTVDPNDDFNDYNRSNNKTYLAPTYRVRNCSADPSVSYPINTVSYHHIDTRINYLVKDFPTHWNPKEIVLQVQPTDGYPLEGLVIVRYNGQSHELSGWYTDIKVPFPVKLPVLFQIVTPIQRDIRLEWWALDNDYFSHRINRTPPEDPDCLVSNCIPLKNKNTSLAVPTDAASKNVRLSGFPESWDPQSIIVGIHSLNSNMPMPSGYFRVFSRNSRFVQTFYIPQDQYYYEVKIPYTGEGHFDLSISSETSGGGYLISWWPVTN